MNFFVKHATITLKIIGWIQIIGGITGLYLIAYLLLRTDAITGPVLLLFLIGLGLFIFSIYCGTKLLFSHSIQTGIILSLINQALQFLQWGMFGYELVYSSGMELVIGLKGLSLSGNFAVVTSNFAMEINSTGTFLLKINLIAVFIFIVLITIYRNLKASPQPDETSNIVEQ